MMATIVLLPSALVPGQSWATVLARVERTLIGIVAVTLVAGPWTPDPPPRDLYLRVRRLAAAAHGWSRPAVTATLNRRSATSSAVQHRTHSASGWP